MPATITHKFVSRIDDEANTDIVKPSNWDDIHFAVLNVDLPTECSGILPATSFPALTGDITTPSGSVATTLATVNSNVGSFGSSTAIPSFTINGKGLVTAASTNAVVAPAGTLTGTTLAPNVVTSSLTALGTVTTGIWNGSIIAGTYGGTGINNGAKTITLGGNLTTAGAFNSTFTMTGTTTVTFPTSGTLVNTAGTGATGTWGISISGNAATVTTNANLTGDVTSVGNAATLTKSAVVQNVTTQTGTTYTLVPGDANGKILFSNAATCTVTVDTNANQAIAIGARITLKSTGGAAALLTVTAAGGVTIVNSTLLSVGDGGIIVLEKSATNTWEVLRLYEEYTHTTNWNGIHSPPQAGNVTIVRDMRNVSIILPQVIASMNFSAAMAMATVFPARFRVSANTETKPIVIANGASGTTAGAGTLNSGGDFTIYATVAYNNFSGSGSGGFYRQALNYVL